LQGQDKSDKSPTLAKKPLRFWILQLNSLRKKEKKSFIFKDMLSFFASPKNHLNLK
jgi:hypothetical protein